MEIENIYCRLCLLEIPNSENKINVFQAEKAVEIIERLINIVITENDCFSKHICYTCDSKLNIFDNYCKTVQENDSLLKENHEKSKTHSLDPEILNSDAHIDDNVTHLDNHVNSKQNDLNIIENDINDTMYVENDHSNESNSDNSSREPLILPKIILSELSADSKKKYAKPIVETPNDKKIKSFYKYECDLCKNHSEINTFREFKTHYRVHHKIAAYIKCCGKRFTRACSLVEHIDEHLMPESLICPTCNKKLRTKQTLLLHMDMHIPSEQRPLKCKHCDMRFMRKNFLKQHEFVHLTGDKKKFICDICGKRYPTSWKLNSHMTHTHSDEKPFVCEVCGKHFKLKVQLVNHMFVHNDKEEYHKQCEHCGLWYKSPRSYYVHFKNIHDENAPKSFPCDKCNHISPTRKALYAHHKNKHGPKNLNCIYCSEAFSSSSLLKSHMVRHTGPGEPLKCPLCPKIFRFRSGYYSHKKKCHPSTQEVKQ